MSKILQNAENIANFYFVCVSGGYNLDKEIYDGMEAVKKGDSMFLGRFWVYPPTIFYFIMKCQTSLCPEEILLAAYH